MWLINTHNFKLQKHDNWTETKYAILSHTWLPGKDDEVNFQDFENLDYARLKKPESYSKIKSARDLAFRQGYEWLWVDSCCIQKPDGNRSIEVSTAIENMYRWYQKSAIYYAFLSDLPTTREPGHQAFKECRWWTRGWTLQELIAPSEVEFYDQKWKKYGTRSVLQKDIQSFTGIPPEAYEGSLKNFPVAQRLSWASRRKTTLPEDISYCLLGLFDIKMRPDYGEGENAFVRLQAKVLKASPDMTIFAWTKQPSLRTYTESEMSQKHFGLLASHPSEFAGCANLTEKANMQWSNPRHDTHVNSQDIVFDGLDLELDDDNRLIMSVGWYDPPSGGDYRLFIRLEKTIGGYVRVDSDHLVATLGGTFTGSPVPGDHVDRDKEFLNFSIIHDHDDWETTLNPTKSICPKRLDYVESLKIDEYYENALCIKVPEGIKVSAAFPPKNWVREQKAFIMEKELTGAVLLEFQSSVPDCEPDELILLFNCDRSIADKCWTYLNFRVLGKESRQQRLGPEEREFSRLKQRIIKEEMISSGLCKIVQNAIPRGRGGKRKVRNKSPLSTWKAKIGGYNIEAEEQRDPGETTSGKAVLRLRVTHAHRL